MSAENLLTLAGQVIFLLLGALTLVDFLRHRQSGRLDVALMFSSVAVSILLSEFRDSNGAQLPRLIAVGNLALVAQPYLLLRLVRYFRSVPGPVQTASAVGLLASWILIVTAQPLPTASILVLVVYFVFVEGYAAVAFVRGALTTTGVTHWRLSLAALGSGLVAAVIFLAVATAMLPGIAGVSNLLVRSGTVLAALAYYLGFVPPQSLRRAWQLSELYRFLRAGANRTVPQSAEKALDQLCRSATRAVGGLAAMVALWDGAEKRLTTRASDVLTLRTSTFSTSGGAIGRAWQARQPTVAFARAALGEDAARALGLVNSDALYAVPLLSGERAWGLLLVCLRRGPLFAEDDLDLLSLLAEQTANVLEATELVARQRTLVEAAPDAIVTVNRDGNIILVNAQTEKLFGYGRDELLGKPVEVLLPDRLQGAHTRHRADYSANPHTRPMGIGLSLAGRSKDGQEIPVEVTLSPLRTETEVYTISVVRDITERKQAEDKLRYERDLMQALLDNLPYMIYFKDTASRFIRINAVQATVLGVAEPEQAIGKTDFDFQWDEISTVSRAEEQRIMETGEKVIDRVEFNPTKDGRPRWITSTKAPIRDKIGAIYGLVGISRDITEQKQIEDKINQLNASLTRRTEQLQESEAKFSKAFRASPAAISIATLPDGRWIEVNEALTNMTGYSSEELIGHTSAELGLVDAAARAKILEAIRTQGSVRDVEIQLRTKSNDAVDVLLSVEEIELNGQPCTVAIQYDITQLKRAEREVRRLNADLERRQIALEAANKELEAFTYSVAHDLRAPLRAIDGFSRLLLEEHASHLDSEAVRYLHTVRRNGQRMGALIDDLLAFSRLGRQSLKKQSVLAADLVRRVFADLSAETEGRQIELSIGELPPCQADPALLQQVFANLLSNAVKFSKGRDVARIEVGCQRSGDGDGPIYFVKDNGAGFDMQYADKLFGVFQRLHSAQEYEGTGIGLAIVQRIIHRHGGRIWAEAEIDRGATFYFTLGENHD